MTIFITTWLDIAVHKNWESHIDASHSRQPLVKGERLVRYEVHAVILKFLCASTLKTLQLIQLLILNCTNLLQQLTPCAPLAQILLPMSGCIAHSIVPCQCNT